MPRFLASGALLLGLSHVAQAIHYFHGLSSLHDLKMVGIIDENGYTKKQTLLTFANRNCFDQIYAVGFPFEYFDLPDEVFEFGQIMIEPKNELTDMFDASETCRTFVFIPAHRDLSDPASSTKILAESQSDLEDWFWSQNEATLDIVNDLDYPVEMYWESRIRKNEESNVMDLTAGEEKKFQTFLGHTFIFRRTDNKNLVARVVLTGEDDLRLSELVNSPGDTEILQLNDETMRIWRGRLASNYGRLLQNERQPPGIKRYTPVGFKKTRIPDNVYKAMVQYLKDNEGRRVAEGWEKDDTHVNFWDSMTTVVHLDNNIRQTTFAAIQPLLEAWVNIELDATSFYGIRRYYEKSWLRDHVDIGETHVVSAIFNIDQDVEEPWILHILDHHGQRHFIEMAPGDMVYYESAVAIHGRPIGMKGKFYDNAFIHYRPLSWAQGNREPYNPEEDEYNFENMGEYEEETFEEDMGVEEM